MLKINCKFRKESDDLMVMFNGSVLFGNGETYKILNYLNKTDYNSITELIKEYLLRYDFENQETYDEAYNDCCQCIQELLESGMIIETRRSL